MRLLVFTLSGLFFLYALASAVPPDALRIQNSYADLKDIKGSFIQKSFIKDLKKTTIYKGEFFIKQPSRMRWKYNGQEVIINGPELLIIQRNEGQAFRGKFTEDVYGQIPLALLGGFADITKDFDITQADRKLILKPKGKMGLVLKIEILPSEDSFPIASLKITDIYSNTVEITVSDVVLNAGIADSVFTLSVPEGLKVFSYGP